MRSDFHFEGKIPSSKSLLNRALILRSHAPNLKVYGDSDADDVVFLRKSLGKIEDGKEFYLGEGGTTLRFFALRAAREKGSFLLKGSERLFRRPQGALKEILAQFGVNIDSPAPNCFQIRSAGWRDPGKPLKVPTGDSSQFASAIVLNAWNLSYDLELEFEGAITSESYFRMTLDLCREAGMEFEESPGRLKIPARQKIALDHLRVEPDLSSLFSIAALAALGGRAKFLDMPERSLQPDSGFVEVFRRMGIPIHHEGGGLIVERVPNILPVEADLGAMPDLTPVLGVVCAFAAGRSVLHGAPQLKHKESHRVRSTATLLRGLGVEVTERDDGLEIVGNPGLQPRAFDFDPDKDHRLAMAAGILNRLGWNIRILDRDVVNKSFPEFWHLLGAGPHLLIGHRGTGKTSFLRRLGVEDAVDLDEEIERRSGHAVFDLFRNRGEEVFRQWELTTLRDLLRESPPSRWIALGAGVRLDEAELSGRVLWLRRDTDRDGRVFLDRPRLDPSSDPLVEFRQRAKLREPVYRRFAEAVYTIPEGLREADDIERRILAGDLDGTGGVVTLTSAHRRTIPQLGAHLYELRDDLLESDEFHSLFHKIPEEKILYSVRRHKTLPDVVRDSRCMIDWGLDGSYPEKEFIEEHADRLILSSHGSLKEALLDFRLYAKYGVRLKMSPVIESYEDLKAGHLWWSQDPVHRHFLPRSNEGRWGWYRLWMKGRSAINFWREGTGSSGDQPTLSQWLATPWGVERFAAVLGSPVHHSWTPAEHRRFFAERGMPVWAIDVREGEWDRALPFLFELGLRFAAVTSPLKGRAFRSSRATPLALELSSVNTLAWDEAGQRWMGHNTDLMGLEAAVRGLPEGPVAVWGGGGTLPVLGRVLPKAAAYSATGGHLRQGSAELTAPPTVVVWAAPRGPDLVWPPDNWKPEVILDLNYKEDSPGREYALRVKARYVSGEKMFRAQAAGQREFWQDFPGGSP